MDAMRKPKCLIDIDLASALNQFLYAAGMHKNAYKKLGFICPECKKRVSPHKAQKGSPRAHFEHVAKSECKGPKSWH
jgi:hypothetical protein